MSLKVCFTLIFNRYTSPASAQDEQKVDKKLSKYSVTARMANGQLTTRTVDASQNNFLAATSSQIESTRHLKSPTGTCSPSVLGIRPGNGVNGSPSFGNDSQRTLMLVAQSEAEEVDPDVIPNQYGGTPWVNLRNSCLTRSIQLFLLSLCTERRPTKVPFSLPLLSTSSAAFKAGCREQEEAVILNSFQNSNAMGGHSFQQQQQQPSKQAVSEELGVLGKLVVK